MANKHLWESLEENSADLECLSCGHVLPANSVNYSALYNSECNPENELGSAMFGKENENV